MIAHRKTLAITGGVLLALILGGGLLRATVLGPESDSYKVCVDQHGNVRFLGDQLRGPSNTTCKKNEVLYELPSNQRVAALETQVANLLPTPTPDPMVNYQVVRDILGSTGVILPLIDPNTNAFASSFDTMGAIQATFAWSGLPFDMSPSFQGLVPVATFNGTDEFATSPDDVFWTQNDGGAPPADVAFSVGLWIHIPGGSNRALLGKWESTGSNREWDINTRSNNRPVISLRDESGPASASRQLDTPIPTNVWVFLVVTYDGRGGSTAADGITWYLDDAVRFSTASTGSSYVGAENKTAIVELGRLDGSAWHYNGKVAGGPCGPFFTKEALTLVKVQNLYNLCRALMDLP